MGSKSEDRTRAERTRSSPSKRRQACEQGVRHTANRAQVEDDFLRSHSSDPIAREYGLADDDSPTNPHPDFTGHYERVRLISALER
jgi:hypothetical protein